MKFNLLIEELLLEISSPEEIWKKYYKDIEWPLFCRIVHYDPQTVVTDSKLVKIGKYGKVLLHMYRNGKIKMEDLPKATEYLKYVYKYNIPIDSNKIKDLPTLYGLISRYIVSENPNLSTVFKILPREEYKTLHNGEKWMILKPKTERAACYLGVNTQWCTTWGQHSLNKGNKTQTNQFKSYNKRGPLYIIINKDDADGEKYQFHFQSRQFMNSSDAQINASELLNQNDELKYFFFPSLIKNVSEKEKEDELEKIQILSPEDTMILLRNVIGDDSKNPLAEAIIKNDIDRINELIKSDELYNDVDLEKGHIEFDLKKIYDNLSTVESTLGWYGYDVQNSYEQVRSDINDSDSDYNWSEELGPAFDKYYMENSGKIMDSLSVPNIETFKTQFFDNFITNEKIRDSYIEEIITMSEGNYETSVQEEIDSIEKYITIEQKHSFYEVYVPVGVFIVHLIKKKITGIGNGEVNKIIDEYIDEYNVPTEYQYVYDYDYKYPIYNENTHFTSKIDDYFEEIFDNAEENVKCVEYRKTLNDVIQRIFKGSTTFENDHVTLTVENMGIDCEFGTVKATYYNKDSGGKYEGNIKVDNLASYALNYKLFESYISFRKNTSK
jgi:hypothetical protein